MVRLQPGVLDINTDDVRFAGKLLEEESRGTTCWNFMAKFWNPLSGGFAIVYNIINI